MEAVYFGSAGGWGPAPAAAGGHGRPGERPVPHGGRRPGLGRNGEPGLANRSCVSFKSANGSGDYLRHYDSTAWIAADGGPSPQDAASLWSQDTTWALAAP
ncbi:MAG TPA: AbfB domain-containing protein [Trebonia sp.]